MLWPVISFLAMLAAVAVHLAWRQRCRRERRQAEAELALLRQTHEQQARQIQSQQQALFNSMAEGLLLLDATGRIRLANRAFNNLFAVTADLRSRTIMEALRLHELAELVDFLGTQRQVLGYELKLAGNPERWLQVNGAAVLDEQGGRDGTILVFHELTRLKQLERTRQEFVANVSHELRTPLSLIKGYAETLLDGARDNPEVAGRFLQSIDRNADRLRLLIEDLLTISELESGRVTLQLQPVSLGPVVRKVLADFKSRAEAREVRLVEEIPELRVQADPGRLEQVLTNLIDNAIKYGSRGGTARVGARPLADGQIEVVIADDGPGIPAEATERVFERFYRADKARSREQGGTGLGLSIVKHIVQTHGGRTWVKSEPGKGASFFFSLPQAAAEAPPGS